MYVSTKFAVLAAIALKSPIRHIVESYSEVILIMVSSMSSKYQLNYIVNLQAVYIQHQKQYLYLQSSNKINIQSNNC